MEQIVGCLLETIIGDNNFYKIIEDEEKYNYWCRYNNNIFNVESVKPIKELEEGCIFYSNMIHSIANWGKKQQFKYDGITSFSSLNKILVELGNNVDKNFLDINNDILEKNKIF